MITIQTTSDPFYTTRVTLDGTDYILDFKYNQRQDRWYLTIQDANGNELVSGVKIVCNWPLLMRFANSALPVGELIAVALTDDDTPPGLNELGPGLRVELTYFEVSDIQEAVLADG